MRSLLLYLLAPLLLTLSAVAGLFVWHEHRQLEHDRLGGLARIAAAAAEAGARGAEHVAMRRGGDKLVLDERDTLELVSEFRHAFLHWPNLVSVALVRPDGSIALDRRREGAPIEPAAGKRWTVPAKFGQPAVESTAAGMSAWHPVPLTQPAGWLRVELTWPEQSDTHRGEVFEHLYFMLALTSAVTIVLGLLLHRTLGPLREAIAFAKRLPADPGAQMPATSKVAEFGQLTAALNEASRRLRGSIDRMVQHEADLQAVLDTSGDAVVALDQDARIALVNARIGSIFGLTEQEAIGRPIAELIAELIPARIDELIAGAPHTGSQGLRLIRFQAVGTRNGGETEFPVEVSLARIDHSSRLRYALAMRDDTERVIAEQLLRQSQEQAQLMAMVASRTASLVTVTDADYRIQWVNDSYLKRSGYPLHELVGRSAREVTHGAHTDSAAVRRVDEAIARGEGIQGVEALQYRQDGAKYWVEAEVQPVRDEEGRLTHWVVIENDITERVTAEQATARRRAQLDLILNLSPDGFLMLDGNGHFAYANKAFCRMTGLAVEALAAADAPQRLDALIGALADPKAPWPGIWAPEGETRQITLMRPERRILNFQVQKSAASGDRVLLVRDITRESEVDRMKSEFLSTAAHELRTPMVSIFGFSELLMNRSYEPERARNMLATIHKQAGLIINLINELLDLARIEARQGKDFRFETQALGALIEETLSGFLVCGDPRKVELSLPAAPLWVAADAAKLRQALNNVISNAYKYSPAGGAITLQLAEERHDGRALAAVRVRDQGIGMTPEQLSRVFQRFFRADPSGKIAGTGLGLCIVKEIIELHGGAAEVRSEAGRGTEVILRLPLQAAPGGAAAVEQTGAAGAQAPSFVHP